MQQQRPKLHGVYMYSLDGKFVQIKLSYLDEKVVGVV
jgi:hypothetical protein